MPKKARRDAEAISHVNDTKYSEGVQGIKTIEGKVEQVLRQHPATRSNDRLLVVAFYDEYYGVFNEPFWQVMSRNDLPSTESITRCRRKIQERDESLRADKRVERKRIDRQLDFIEYAEGM